MNVEVLYNSFFNSTINVIISENSLDKDVLIVDCGDSGEIIEKLHSQEKIPRGILLTHGHFDHIFGLNKLLQAFPECYVYTNSIGKEMLLDARKNISHYYGKPLIISYPENIKEVRDGEEVTINDELKAKAIFTPGHNPSCITWIIDDCIFTGDSYIPGIKTVTNLPGGNRLQANDSEAKILNLARNRIIYPGHKI